MKTATVTELKKELSRRSQEELTNLCLKLARYKKENKELLTYLLFEAGNEEQYIASVKNQIEEEFKSINKTNLYLAKKTIRRVLRLTKKYIKYSGKKETAVELLIFYCQKLQETKLPIKDSKVLLNLYQKQIDAIRKSVSGLHEDLQFDYEHQISSL